MSLYTMPLQLCPNLFHLGAKGSTILEQNVDICLNLLVTCHQICQCPEAQSTVMIFECLEFLCPVPVSFRDNMRQHDPQDLGRSWLKGPMTELLQVEALLDSITSSYSSFDT